MKTSICLALLILGLPTLAAAQSAPTRSELVHPSQRAADLLSQAEPAIPVLTPQAETRQPAPPATPVYTVPAAQIEKQGAQSLADVLRGLPGFAINDVGPGADIHTGTYYRGASINQSTLLLNGRPFGTNINTYHGTTDFNALPVEAIEKVELTSGASSTLYGSEGFGGVLNVVTKKGRGQPRLSASLEYGSYGQSNYRAASAGAGDQFSYTVNYQSFLADNRYGVPFESVNRGPDGRLFNGDAYRNSYAANFSYEPDSRNTLSFDLTKIVSRKGLLYFGFPGNCNPALPLQCDRLDHDGLNTGLNWRSQLGGGEDSLLSVSLGYNQDYFNTYGPNQNQFSRTGSLDSQLISARIEHDWYTSPGHRLRYSFDLLNNSLTGTILSTNPARAANNGGESHAVFNGAFFALSSWTVAKPLQLELGVRQTVNSLFGSYTNPSLGIRYALSPDVALRASWVLAQRNPGLDQLFVYDTVHGWLPNPNLVPETGSAYTAGFDVRFSEALSGQFTYFGSGLANRLAVGSDNRWQNIGSVATNGLELALRWQIAPEWSSFLNYTYTDAKILTGSDAGLQLGLVPYSVGQAGVGYDHGGYQANLIATYGSGSRRAFYTLPGVNNTDFSSPWLSLDLRTRIPLTPNLAFTAYIENLADVPYERANRIFTPGILYRIGVETSL